MEMSILEWGKFNGLTPDEFETEITESLAALCMMKLEEPDNIGFDRISYTIANDSHEFLINVTKSVNTNET